MRIVARLLHFASHALVATAARFRRAADSITKEPPDLVARREMEAAGHREGDIRMVVDQIRCDTIQERT